MKKENLVVLRSDKALEIQSDTMYPNTYYRSLDVEENGIEEYIVNGIPFNKVDFEKHFELAYDKIMRDWERIGLVKGGKLITKKGFKELANVHLYGKQNNNLRIIFFGHPKECMYGFYPIYRESKAKQLDAMYLWCKLIIEGGMMRYFDRGNIQFGNCGIPISYGDLRVN